MAIYVFIIAGVPLTDCYTIKEERGNIEYYYCEALDCLR